MGLFSEYMDAKGNIKKPSVDVNGGKPSPETPPDKPPTENGKTPYVAKGEKNKNNKALGDLGDTKFDCDKSPSPAKIPMAEQAEIAALVVDAINKDASLVEQLVFQLRNKKLLGPIVAEMLNYKETYQHISEVMSHEVYGPTVCSKLTRAMNEEIAPPMSASLEGQDIEDSAEESEEGDEFDNEMMGDEMMGDEMMGDEMMGDEMMGDEMMGDEMMGDEMMGDEMMNQNPQAAPQPRQSQAMMNFQRAMMSRR